MEQMIAQMMLRNFIEEEYVDKTAKKFKKTLEKKIKEFEKEFKSTHSEDEYIPYEITANRVSLALDMLSIAVMAKKSEEPKNLLVLAEMLRDLAAELTIAAAKEVK